VSEGRDGYGEVRTPYAVFCDGPDYTIAPGCGLVYMTEQQYEAQMSRPDALWRCPRCNGDARFDDENYEESLESADAE
jgi:hypothetical protein